MKMQRNIINKSLYLIFIGIFILVQISFAKDISSFNKDAFI
ncbi:unnamed protein product, partial [marine sediment metagenome]